MNWPTLVFLAFSIFHSASCTQCSGANLASSVRTNFASDGTNFALNLYKKARELAKDDSENIFLSPTSVFLAVGMVNVGARGSTRSEIQRVLMPSVVSENIHNLQGWLHSQLNSEGKKYQLHSANGVFLQDNLKVQHSFLQTLESCFHSEAETVDFNNEPEKARQEINEWVEDHTNDKILDLIPASAIDPDTRVVLANAIYFKGEWDRPFVTKNRATTYDSHFFPQFPSRRRSELQKIKIMKMENHFFYHETHHLQVLGIPYKSHQLTMFIFLPKQGSLRQFEERLLHDGSSLTDLMDKVTNRTVKVKIPKFKMTTALRLKRALQNLGMSKMFSMRADLSGITEGGSLHVDDAFHKAFVEVNEKGTEAAAATASTMRFKSMPIDPPPSFYANHPFLFLIRHESTKAILFMGSLSNADTLDKQ